MAEKSIIKLHDWHLSICVLDLVRNQHGLAIQVDTDAAILLSCSTNVNAVEGTASDNGELTSTIAALQQQIAAFRLTGASSMRSAAKEGCETGVGEGGVADQENRRRGRRGDRERAMGITSTDPEDETEQASSGTDSGAGTSGMKALAAVGAAGTSEIQCAVFMCFAAVCRGYGPKKDRHSAPAVEQLARGGQAQYWRRRARSRRKERPTSVSPSRRPRRSSLQWVPGEPVGGGGYVDLLRRSATFKNAPSTSTVQGCG
ncbi:unnamed protein product [Symbiodinium sp. KB8]|nr:unnamed protein product [Symbiodinium sp. KB8]